MRGPVEANNKYDMAGIDAHKPNKEAPAMKTSSQSSSIIPSSQTRTLDPSTIIPPCHPEFLPSRSLFVSFRGPSRGHHVILGGAKALQQGIAMWPFDDCYAHIMCHHIHPHAHLESTAAQCAAAATQCAATAAAAQYHPCTLLRSATLMCDLHEFRWQVL